MLDTVIQEFGQRMNIDNLCLNEQNFLCLDIENIGRLHLEHDQDKEQLFICLSLPYPEYEGDIPRKILEACSYRHGHAIEIRGGVNGGWAMLLSTVDSKNVQVAELENTIHILHANLAKIFNK